VQVDPADIYKSPYPALYIVNPFLVELDETTDELEAVLVNVVKETDVPCCGAVVIVPLTG
jgi:hypothetical protein